MSLSANNINKNRFELIYKEYHKNLCVFAESYLLDENIASGIVQDSFIKLWEIRDSIRDTNKIKSFLFTTVKNLCLNKIRDNKKNADISILESKTFFDETVIKNETYRLFYKALDKLSPRNREIILLSLKGYKNREISDELNIKLNTVISSKRDSYKSLRKNLGKFFYLFFI